MRRTAESSPAHRSVKEEGNTASLQFIKYMLKLKEPETRGSGPGAPPAGSEMSRMNIQQLKYFVELCKYQSITTAANHLFISQQGLSMAIIRLETEFNCKFFNRTPHGLILTEDGKYFLDRARGFLDTYDQCIRHFEHSRSGENAFRLAVAQGTLGEFGAYCIGKYKDQYPDYFLRVKEYQDRACDMALENMDAELAFGIWPFDDRKFEHIPVFEARAGLVLRTDHPLAREGLKEIPSSKLQDLQLITVDERMKTADFLLQKLEKKGIKPRVRLRVGEIIGVHRLAMEGLGAGLTNMSITKVLNTPNTVTIPLEDPEFVWRADIVRRRGEKLGENAETFWKFVVGMAPLKNLKPVGPGELEDYSIDSGQQE